MIRTSPNSLAIVIGLFAFGLAPPWADAAESGAATATAAPSTLTLDQALAMARKRSRSLVVERTRLAQAQTNIDQAWAALFPTIAVQGKYTHNDFKDVSVPFGAMGSNIVIQPQEQLDGAINATVPLIAPPAYPALEAVRGNVRAAEAYIPVISHNVPSAPPRTKDKP